MEICVVSTKEKRITLANQDLTQIPDYLLRDYSPFTEILDLSYNNFKKFGFLSKFKNLKTLFLDHNELVDDEEFPALPSLTTLSLNHNKIKKISEFLPNLKESFPNLKFLSLFGNEGAPSFLRGGSFYDYLIYRYFVIFHFQNLNYLDDRPVTIDQVLEAKRLFEPPLHIRIIKDFTENLRKFSDLFPDFNSSLSSNSRSSMNADDKNVEFQNVLSSKF